MYEVGLEVGRDQEDAQDLYRRATDGGVSVAHFHVQWLTKLGSLERRELANDSVAISLYHRGAEQGHVAAQHCLARMYEIGRGVAKDKGQAIMWYSKASAQGHGDAMERMKHLQKHLD
ncbi:hypothetical protein K457DRAFT_1819813 [Linnemannia elongata AG-77]|uniref:HCP-like protein n=1 Tax=Linnemannia elongata AG-77 TaxID=1314771 RepID=A0A197JXQ8_9FUNG|nr:hypothetical protein K457DRAFT_1819813 [Linnemannia elongata AG-77]